MQSADRLHGRRLDRIGDRDEASDRSVDGDKHRRLTFGAHGVGLSGEAAKALGLVPIATIEAPIYSNREGVMTVYGPPGSKPGGSAR